MVDDRHLKQHKTLCQLLKKRIRRIKMKRADPEPVNLPEEKKMFQQLKAKKKEPINILVTIDENYAQPLFTMLYSLFLNNSKDSFKIHLIYADLSDQTRSALNDFCEKWHHKLFEYPFDPTRLEGAPITKRYPQSMYYRLLAHRILPCDLDKILYLDPDILVINSLETLIQTDISHYLFAGAAHTSLTGVSEHFNRIRLNTYQSEGYFNSGVLLMNLGQMRKRISEHDIFSYIDSHKIELLLPDQDVLNGLYGDQILQIADELYNYDARNYQTYYLVSSGKIDVDWIMKNTVILHFCGKNKPWSPSYGRKFAVLYKHYHSLSLR